jgi:hypothetical protein
MENPADVGVTAVFREAFELDETGEVMIPILRGDSLLCVAFFLCIKEPCQLRLNLSTPLREIAAQRLCSTRRFIQRRVMLQFEFGLPFRRG